MRVEVGFMSPRTSHLNDDIQENKTSITPMDTASLSTTLDHILNDTTFDFTFNIGSNISFNSSTADELFFDGKIIPYGTKKEKVVMPCLDPPSQMVENDENKKSLKEIVGEVIEEKDQKPNTAIQRSFWKFGRSRSLHCDKSQLKMLPRSGSTGKCLGKIVEEDNKNVENPIKKSFWKLGKSHSLNSSKDLNTAISGGYPNPLQKSSSKRVNGFNLNPFIRRSGSLNCDTRKGGNDNILRRSFSTSYVSKKEQQFVANDAKTCKKRQVRSSSNKGCGYGNYGNNNNNNVRVSYVLNVPPPYISRASLDLFGFGSLCYGIKNRKKRK